MIRRPPRTTQSRSSGASDVYKRQGRYHLPADPAGYLGGHGPWVNECSADRLISMSVEQPGPSTESEGTGSRPKSARLPLADRLRPVSYTHLRAHETRHDLVCRLLLEKKK